MRWYAGVLQEAERCMAWHKDTEGGSRIRVTERDVNKINATITVARRMEGG